MAIAFVGASSQYVSIPTGAYIRNCAGASIMGWMNKPNNDKYLFGFNGLSTSPVKTRLSVRCYSGDPFQLEAEGRALDSDSTKYYNAGAFTAGAWNHFIVVADWVNRWIKIYRNGALAGTSGTLTWTSGNCQDNDNTTGVVGNVIGCHPGIYGYITGSMEDMRVYNRIITAEEAMAIYVCKGHDEIKYGLTGRWLCKGAYPGQVITSVIDSGPLQKHGTPSGSPTGAEGKLAYRKNV